METRGHHHLWFCPWWTYFSWYAGFLPRYVIYVWLHNTLYVHLYIL